MVLLEFSMTPIGKGESVSRYVARCVDLVDRSGLRYRLNPMGTVVEGEWDEVLAVVTKCYRRLSRDCPRVSVSIKIDARRGKAGRLDAKVDAVERRLRRKLSR